MMLLHRLLLLVVVVIGLTGNKNKVSANTNPWKEVRSISLVDITKNLKDGDAQREFGDVLSVAEGFFQKATNKQWRKTLDESEKAFPFLTCHRPDSDGSSSSAYDIQERLRTILFESFESLEPQAAAAANNTEEESNIRTILNTPDLYCAEVRTSGVVALETGVSNQEFTFQPILTMMKLMKNTLELLTDLISKVDSDTTSVDINLCPNVKSDSLVSAKTIADLTNTDYLRENLIWWDESDEDDVPNKNYWNLALDYFEGGVCKETIENQLLWESDENKNEGEEEQLEEADKLDFITLTIRKRLGKERTDAVCGLVAVAAIMLSPDVCSVETRKPPKTMNRQAQWLVQTGIEGETPFYDVFNITGEGQVIAVSDSGLDYNNCYFKDNRITKIPMGKRITNHRSVVEYSASSGGDNQDYLFGHGTHVCGSIVGSRGGGPKEGMVPGIAPGAKIAFMDLGQGSAGSLSLPGQTSLLMVTGRQTSGRGFSFIDKAKIHSASWGTNDAAYTSMARGIDKYMYQNDEMLMIVAAGNSGADGPGTVGSPASAKNALAVGASHSYGPDLKKGPYFGLWKTQLGVNHVADFSSRGPTPDGRRKPEIMAPGKYILSAGARPDMPGACDPNDGEPPAAGEGKDGVKSMAGTSMATPIVSGSAALIRQYFEQGHYQKYYPITTNNKLPMNITSPSGALVKAVILNGGQFLDSIDSSSKNVPDLVPYDNIQGFGRISYIDSLYLPGYSNVQIQAWERVNVANGIRVEYKVTIDKSKGCESDLLSVTLVWMDVPGVVGCKRKCLVNNLDLTVRKNSTVYYPNGLNEPDTINNVERVQIFDTKDKDIYTITVHAQNLDTKSQNFALVATGCFGGVKNTLDISRNVYDNDNSRKDLLYLQIGIIAGASTLLLCLLCGPTYCCHRKRKKKKIAKAAKIVSDRINRQRLSQRPSTSDKKYTPAVVADVKEKALPPPDVKGQSPPVDIEKQSPPVDVEKQQQLQEEVVTVNKKEEEK